MRDFLTSMPARPAILATVRADGRPHVAPIWYAVDDDGTIVFNTGETTVKGRTLRRTGYAALTVDDDRAPFSFVALEGPVEISDDLDEVRHWAGVIGGRYMGADRADEYGRPQRGPRRAGGPAHAGQGGQRRRSRRLTARSVPSSTLARSARSVPSPPSLPPLAPSDSGFPLRR